jgi:hypothetical protein
MLSLILSRGTTESKLQSPAVLPLGKKPRVSTEQVAWWAPEPAWKLWSRGRGPTTVRTVFVFALLKKILSVFSEGCQDKCQTDRQIDKPLSYSLND